MTIPEKITLDQTDVLALNVKLTADFAAANAQLAQAAGLAGQNATLVTERDALAASNATLTASNLSLIGERDTLTAENTKLAVAMSNFDLRLASEMAKHGIRKEAVKIEPATADKKLTATERCLAAKGVK